MHIAVVESVDVADRTESRICAREASECRAIVMDDRFVVAGDPDTSVVDAEDR
jgi:hypothetical protein